MLLTTPFVCWPIMLDLERPIELHSHTHSSRSHGFFCVVDTLEYMKMYLNNFYKLIEYAGHRSTVKFTWLFVFFCVCMILRLPAEST